MTILIAVVALVLLLFFAGIRIIRPTHRGLIEVFGKYKGFAQPGFHWVIPVVTKMYQITRRKQHGDAEPQRS